VDAARRISRAVTDASSPRSLSGLMRARRWGELLGRFPALRDMRVLDLGGLVGVWERAPVAPREVTVLNIFEQDAGAKWIRTVVGDACELPDRLRGQRWDLVYCNSVIEHVGGHWRREALAESIHALGEHHWVQTPYRYFPIEPHWLFPGFQFLPVRARAEVTVRWPFGNYRGVHELEHAVEWTLVTELLSRTEMERYFPRSEIVSESIGPLVKSLIAVR
jgi:hypothetical protein